MQESVIERINTWCGQRIVERLKITQDLQPAARSAPRRPKVAVTPTELPDMPEGPLRTALEALGTRLRERGRR